MTNQIGVPLLVYSVFLMLDKVAYFSAFLRLHSTVLLNYGQSLGMLHLSLQHENVLCQ